MEQTNFYENTQYSFERTERKTIILDIDYDDLVNEITFDGSTNGKGKLLEPLRIDVISDIYLDNLTIADCIDNGSANPTIKSGFIFDIEQFDIKNNSNNSKFFNKLIIPNENGTSGGTKTQKSRKMNYVSTINPKKIDRLSGSISLLDGSTRIFKTTSNGRLTAEFVIIAK